MSYEYLRRKVAADLAASAEGEPRCCEEHYAAWFARRETLEDFERWLAEAEAEDATMEDKNG